MIITDLLNFERRVTDFMCKLFPGDIVDLFSSKKYYYKEIFVIFHPFFLVGSSSSFTCTFYEGAANILRFSVSHL